MAGLKHAQIEALDPGRHLPGHRKEDFERNKVIANREHEGTIAHEDAYDGEDGAHRRPCEQEL